MANFTWPASLPQNPFGSGNPQYQPNDHLLRTEMKGGPAKVRPLVTNPSEILPVVLRLGPAQRQALQDFIKTTLKYVEPFNWIDFRTQVACEYRYADKALPAEKYLGESVDGTWWEVSFKLEKMP